MASAAQLPSPMKVARAERPLRIAFVYGRTPLPMTRADQMTVAHLLAFLSARGHAVDLFTLDIGEKTTPEQRQWLAQRCRKIEIFRQGKVASVLGLFGALLRGKPMQVGWFTNRAHIAAVRRAVAAGDYDIAYTYYIRNAEALRGISPAGARPGPGRPATILAMQLSQALNTKRIAKHCTRIQDKLIYTIEQYLVRNYEARIWREFSRVALISRNDVEEIRTACAELGLPAIDNYFLAPHGVDIDRFRPRGDVAVEPATLVFSGVLATNTNINAVLWFVAKCWPAIKAAVPEARLIVVGRSPTREIVALGERDASILVTGEVPDPADYIARATLCINPIQVGAGMQNKLIEYFAGGKAVVATRLANEGIGAKPGEHFVAADTAEEFAAGIVALIRDPARRQRLGAAAREFVQQNWTWEKWFLDLEAEMVRCMGPREASGEARKYAAAH